MIRNGKDIANGTVVSTQVCVIGSGPAGITLAWHLQKAGLKVTLIEGSRDYRWSGLEDSWEDKKKLYGGVADGLFKSNEPGFLIQPYDGQKGRAWERERIYGGTSAHWAGQTRPLDPITFEERPGFPSWPISRQDLDPYYVKAATFCELYGHDFGAEYWASVLDADVPPLGGVDTEMYQFIDANYRNFAVRKFDGITIGESGADVILNASLLDIDHTGGVVTSVHVASMDGDQSSPKKATEFTIKADAFVLACGAVANARQLLLSNAGNEHGQVGCYFTCHPIPRDNLITIEKDYLTERQLRLMRGETPGGARWTDPNGIITVEARLSPSAEQQRKLGIGGCWFSWETSGFYFEMAPNSDSQVTLADTTDPVFGQKQTCITWALSSLDEANYNKSTQLFQTAVANMGGRVSVAPWDESQWFINGHHIGTTRMSADPTKGVVDANLKVHSLRNLWVAGSSVYASAGISNPTFTIVTLSIRLAEHLTGTLGK
jgi:choline dehydrogenase-like flavoprotein